MYARPTIDGEPTTFGVSGMLWRDSLILYDRATRSLWSQLLGEAVVGPEKGTTLEELPSEQTTWGDWRSRHPDTLVLVKPEGISGTNYAEYHRDDERIGVRGSSNPDDRLPGKTLVYGIERDAQAAAVPFPLLDEEPVVNAHALGVPVVVFSPPGERTALVFERRVDGEVLAFERVSGEGRLTVRDRGSGSTWSWEDGSCLEGPFAGSSLERIPGTAVYWGIWVQFHPDTEVVRGEAEPGG